MMTNEQLKEIKETFAMLEGILSKVNSAESLFNDNPGFNDVFTRAYRCLGVLENEWILKIPGAFDSREAISDLIERVEVIQQCVSHGIEMETGDTLPDRLRKVKAILVDVNLHLNGKKQ